MSTKEHLKICFFGSSGSGKSTCAAISQEIFKKENFRVKRVNVAKPLHEIQAYSNRRFHLPNTGQDGELLQFLAKHYETSLGSCFRDRVLKLESEFIGTRLAIVNSDCRNNSYRYLLELDFIFVRVLSSMETIERRLGKRGDITLAEKNKSVEKIDLIRPNYVLVNEGTLSELKNTVENVVSKIIKI